MTFKEKLIAAALKNDSWLCVGLDPDLAKLPETIDRSITGITVFLKSIIDSTQDLVCAYKPNSAFYEQFGYEGMKLLETIIRYIPAEIPVILDAKRGDIGNTSGMYAKAAFELFGADAVTVNPYMGIDSVKPFTDYKDKAVFILCLTSNPSSGDFQKQKIENRGLLYELVAKAACRWNESGNIGLVIGATRPEELSRIRQLAGNDVPILIPGIGAQGGSLEAAMKNGSNSSKQLAIMNVSRSIIYASPEKDYAEQSRAEALRLVSAMRDLLNTD